MRIWYNIFVIAEILLLVCYLFAFCRGSCKWSFVFSLGIVVCSIVLIFLAIFLEHGAMWVFQLLLMLKYVSAMIDNYQTIT